MPDSESPFRKFTQNKPLFYGSLAVMGIAGVIYYRHKSAATAATAATATTGSIDPATGFAYGTPEDQAALDQMASGSFIGNPFGGGSFGTSGSDGTGGATGVTTVDLSTKEAWIAEAENILPNGHSVEVRDALLGVLGGLTVTSAQRRIFLEATGALGDPPGGYPQPIKVSDTPGHPHNQVTVPNVIGKHYVQAATIITSAGLRPRRAEPNVGIVRTESPHAGSHVARGSTVTLGH